MLKNKTFKSLAVATVLAFGATSFAGPAAFAAQTFKLQAAVGTTTNFNTLNDSANNIVVDDVDGSDANDGTYNLSAGFSLKVFVSNTDNDPYLNLKGSEDALFAYEVQDAASGSSTDIEAAVQVVSDDLDNSNLDGTGTASPSSVADLGSDGEADIALRAESGWQVITLWALNTAGADDIETTDVTATVYGEGDATLGMTAGDDNVGPSAKINFYAPADVTVTTAFDGIAFGDEGVDATVTTSPALNLNQVYFNSTWSLNAEITSSTFANAHVAYLYPDVDSDDLVYLTGDVNWTGTPAYDEFITEATYKLQAKLWDAEGNADETSSAKYAKVTEPDAHSITVDVVSKGNVYDDSCGGYEECFAVRSGTKTVSVEGTVENVDGDAVKGAVVTVTLDAQYLADDETVKAGSKTATAGTSDDTVDVEVTTNADGEYSLDVTVSATAEEDEDAFDIEVTTPVDGEAGSDGYTDAWVWYDDTEYDDFYYTPSNNTVGVTESGTVSITFQTVDQFGEPISEVDGDALKLFAEDSSSVDTEISKSATVSGGKATISFKNAEAAGSQYDVDVYLYVDGDGRTDEDLENAETFNVYVWDAATATVALEQDGEFLDGEVTYYDYVTGTDVPESALDESDLTGSGTEETITGYIEDANGNVQPGAPVTISGKGYLFADISDDVFAADTITVYADDAGYFEADVYSHIAGEKSKITVTSGSGSETALVSFAVPSSIDPADVTWTVSGPSYSQSGKTAVVVATFADKWGNGLPDQDVEIVLDGIGLLNGDDVLSRTTNSHGQVKAYLSVQAGDTGVSDLTFTLDDGDNEYFDVSNAEDDEVLNPVLVKTTHYGSTYAKASAKGNVNVSFGYAKGKRVKVYVDGVLKLNVLKKSDTPVKKSYAAAAGSHKVVVKVDGVVIKSKTVTAK